MIILKIGNTRNIWASSIISSYSKIDDVIGLCNKMEEYQTAAIVSNDPKFNNYVIGNTVNGTTYVGEKARTTGAPQNHWFDLPASKSCWHRNS